MKQTLKCFEKLKIPPKPSPKESITILHYYVSTMYKVRDSSLLTTLPKRREKAHISIASMNRHISLQRLHPRFSSLSLSLSSASSCPHLLSFILINKISQNTLCQLSSGKDPYSKLFARWKVWFTPTRKTFFFWSDPVCWQGCSAGFLHTSHYRAFFRCFPYWVFFSTTETALCAFPHKKPLFLPNIPNWPQADYR